ncbi:MAG: DUF1549 domain-containing protein [Planctomycetaceae bacterium]
MMKPFAVLFCLGVVGLLATLVMKAGVVEPPLPVTQRLSESQNIDESVSRVNAWLRQRWSSENLEPADTADDLTVFRRLSLALHGTIPSLEEVTAFQADHSDDRIQRWLLRMLDDPRFSRYFAERLERVLTGVEEGQFVIFRRDRLTDWLNDQLAADRPWPEVTTELIAAEGLWTSNGASNFITAAFIDQEGIDENKLAGRTVRAFLGQRIDCAQCHDHPFDSWKQGDFEGLAAFYGQARVTPGGVIDRLEEDGQPIEYHVMDPGADDGRLVVPRVPFHPEWLSEEGSRRQQLAAWVTHPENRRFERATANRVWGLMFGRSWYDPVDDLGHPEQSEIDEDLLDVLGREFRSHDGRLKFLIRMIAQSDAFRLESTVPWADAELYTQMDREWAVFPLARLRPEQMIGSMFQAGHIRTIDQNSNLFIRFAKFVNENDFLKEYGDATDDELLQQSGTIPQALLRMNGRFTQDLTDTGIFSAAGQIQSFSGDHESLVRNCFLACLTRLPSPEERRFFVDELTAAEAVPDSKDSISQVVEDLYWVLFNSPGFSWNR